MFGRKNKGRPLLGVDLGSSAVKVVELKRGRAGINASGVALELLTPEIVVDGAILDSAFLGDIIGQMLRELRTKNRAVATAVSGHSVIVKQISMPAMTEEELQAAMATEAAQHIPFELSDVNLDHQVLNLHENGMMDVLLVAVKKDKVTNYTSALSMAGMQPVVIDHDPFAMQNCYEYNYQPDPEVTVGLLNVGASVTNINVVKGTVPLFTRDISVGGNQYTDALQKELNMSFDDAETAKLGSNPNVNEEQRKPVLESVSEIILLEIQKTFDFFRASAGGEQVERLYLCGGSAQIPGLTAMLSQEFAVPVELLDPFRRISVADSAIDLVREQGPRLAVAVGLALRSFEDL